MTKTFCQPLNVVSADAKTNAGSVYTEQAGRANADAALAKIMENALQAYGGKEQLVNFANNIQFIGTITNNNEANDTDATRHGYRLVKQSPQWRLDVENLPKDEGSKRDVLSTIFDGTSYWRINGIAKINKQKNPEAEEAPPLATSFKKNDLTVKLLGAEESKWLADQTKNDPSLLAYWQNAGYSFKLLGKTTYKQIPVLAVELNDNSGTPILIYLDANNYLVVAIVFQAWQPATETEAAQKVTITKEYSENRPVLGSLWPHKEITLVNNQVVSTIELAHILPAKDISVDYFKTPGGQSPSKQIRLSAPITIPFEYSQREIICRGRIDRMEPLWFLIDTGTSNTIIERTVAAQCSLSKGNNFQFSAFQGNIQAQTTTIDRLGLGNLIINDVPAQIADLSSQSKQVGRSIAGIIGMDVLSNYLVTIDYAKPTIQFADAYTGARPAGFTSIPFEHKSGTTTENPPVSRVKCMLPGGDTEIFLMDTGAAFNHLSVAIAKNHLKENLDKSTHTIEGTGLDGRTVKLASLVLEPIILGSYKMHRVKFTYPSDENKSEANIYKELGITGILGNPFFEHFFVTIDCPFHRLLLKSNPQFEILYELQEALNIGDDALFTKRDFRKAEYAYQRVLILADSTNTSRFQALANGRLGNLRRIMAHDLHRPEHIRMAYQYFKRGNELATQGDFKEAQGRILADWSLLYSENGQPVEAQQTMQKAILLAPKDAFVNVDYAVHLFHERQYGEAQKYIEKALFYDPGNWQALWYQIKLSEMFQDTNREKATLREIVQRYPWSKVAQEKLKALESTEQINR